MAPSVSTSSHIPGVWKEKEGKLTPGPACRGSGAREELSSSVGQVGRTSRSFVLSTLAPHALFSSALSGMEPLFPVASEEQVYHGQGKGLLIVWEDLGEGQSKLWVSDLGITSARKSGRAQRLGMRGSREKKPASHSCVHVLFPWECQVSSLRG